jgi:hypothetical protein|tara:strand:+ start:3602 stop:4321 length:720 start_codon:yes stop_codon:yes gene_type:complete
MEPIESLEGKRVALLGLGISQIDYVISLENGKVWDEVWAINSVAGALRCDRLFMMDPASRFFDSEDAGKQTSVMRKILPKIKVPVYTCELDERVPSAVEYPLEKICNYTKCAYFNNTVAYALGFAMYNKVSAIDLFGIDFSYRNDLHFAEAGRACVEFWLCKLMENDITVGVSPRSTVLDADVPADERLYGYHRLEKPLVAVPHKDSWIISTNDKIQEVLQEHDMQLVTETRPPEPYKG